MKCTNAVQFTASSADLNFKNTLKYGVHDVLKF